MITVVEQTTTERNEETKALFEEIRPYLDEGYSYMSACVIIGKVKNELKHWQYNTGWFKDLKNYGEKMGYAYKEYSGRRRK